MNITDLEIFAYNLPFQQSFLVHHQSLNSREGLIVRLILNNGLSGVGEIAPLPGFSDETLKKAMFQLKLIRSQLISIAIPKHLAELKQMFAQEPWMSLCPSVRFGIEMAVVHLMAQIQNCLPAEIMGCSSVDDIAVAGLLQGAPDDIKIQVERLIEQGFTVFKLKVGSKNIPLDVKKVHLVRQWIGPQRKLRLDVNRGWGLGEAVAFCQNAGIEHIEFIEEPLKDRHQLEEFVRTTQWSVAFDESMVNYEPQTFVFPLGVDCLVIKPTLVGGIIKTLDWIDRVKKDHKKIIISSMFESAIGGCMLANLAAFSSLAAGLGTEEWLAQDLLKPLRAQGHNFIPKTSLQFRWEDINMRGLIPVLDQ